jgi:hypothetical protein
MAYPVDEKEIAVRILARQPVPEEIMAPILWGLEEEGIPIEFGEAANGSAENLAKQAANSSPLNVGIGIDSTEQAVVLHHRDLPAGKPLFTLNAGDFQPLRLRQLGVNAARLVKGDPLAFQSGAEQHVGGDHPHQPTHRGTTELSDREMEELQALIVQIVVELFKESRGNPWKNEVLE